ncbi:MAG TPA: SCO family protein [Steroidobacteraceae bacterium]|nr:SCO family protein [Steroidobacteraceae bacterium]
MSGKRFVLYLVPIGLAAALAGYMVSRQLGHTEPPALQSGTALQQPRAVAAFALTDQLGRPFGNAQLAGQPSLMFFGYTHCPDVCPTTLALLARLHRDPALARLHIVFVTVDPQRDDQHTMQQYVDAFGGGITGLTGNDAALAPLLANLGVVRSIQPLPGGDYTVDHSATIYYLDARGAFAAIFTPPFDYSAMRADLIALAAVH